MLARNSLEELVGKTIQGIVVVAENRRSEPRDQIFLLFDDNTYFEFYGDHIHSTGGVDRGGAAEVMRYVQGTQGEITAYPKKQ